MQMLLVATAATALSTAPTAARITTLYGAAAGGLAARALVPGSQSAVLGATALAVLCDYGPSARRDLGTSNEASRIAVDRLIAVSPEMVLVDNFVHNLGAKDESKSRAREEAIAMLKASQRWALFVRCRMMGDAAGIGCMLCGKACVGAALVLAAHTACWVRGGAEARVDSSANPSPLSPPLARIIGTTTGVLTAAAMLCALLPAGQLRIVSSRAYAAALIAIQCARVVADRVRDRTHVGL